jgi:hypothetical protein
MKKYPFSKKAVKAMLVAALALTPAASFGGVQVAAAENEPQVSVAGYSDVASLISRFNSVYDDLTPTEKAALAKAQSYISNINEATWDSYATSVSKNNENIASHKALLQGLAAVSTASNITDLTTKVLEFIDEHDTTVDTVFGSEITVDELLLFIGDAELRYFELSGNFDEISNPEQTLTYIKAAIAQAGAAHTSAYTALNEEVDLEKTLTVLNAIRVASMSTGNAGGGAVIPPVEQPAPGEVALPQGSTETVKQGSTVVTQVPAAKVAEIVTQITAEKAVIPLTLEAPAAGETAKAQLPAALFTQAAEKNANAVVNVKTEEASYQLPVNEINVAALANELGVAAADVKIEISVNVVPQSEVKADLDNNKLNAVSDVIEFTVKAVSGDKELAVSKFSTYVKRTIVGNKTFNPDRTAAVKLVNGKFQAAPATFKGKEATIFKKDNSKYVIVENDKTFSDVNNGKNFAEASIEKLASKYIIFGKSDTEYANSLAITRGEFAALISRSLGLTAQNPTQLKFTDTPSTKAVNQNGEINAAAEAGIVSGYAGNIFKPDQPINRAEAAIMLSKALDYVKVASSEYNTSKKLADFKDDTVIGTTSRQYVEKVYQAGLMSGFSDKSFGPDKSMQRDQMAVVLDKLLQAAELID